MDRYGVFVDVGYLYEPVVLPGTSCVITGINPATGLDAATVTVLANVGINTQLVPSLFSVLVGQGCTLLSP